MTHSAKARLFGLLVVIILLYSCRPDEQSVDLVVHNARIYTVDPVFSEHEAMAITDGRIVEVGAEQYIRNKYSAARRLDVAGRPIYPGFIDSHCHFVGYGRGLSEVDLSGAASWQECLERLKSKAAATESEWIIGNGWDESLWATQALPDRVGLDLLFPDRPVFLRRIDGHAAMVNGEALSRAGISGGERVSGGEVVTDNGEPTGILIDNAMGLVSGAIPEPRDNQLRKAILAAQEDCFAAGLTTVDDAGLDPHVVELIDQLHNEGVLKMRVYAMLEASEASKEWMKENGLYLTDRLSVRSIKLFADGSMGSRGAALKAPYSDAPDRSGELLYNDQHFRQWIALADLYGYQVNTHCIGDRANQKILSLYAEQLSGTNDKRWRIEHAQMVADIDMNRFGKNTVLPSVQPTHVVSDMHWVEDRIGKDRLHTAYPYRSLLDQNGMILLGTDFPVEGLDPLKTFYAAVFRKDAEGQPMGGWHTEQAISRQEALMGMTIWGAVGNFEEQDKGSLQAGKLADFVILDRDIMRVGESELIKTKVMETYIAGERVH